MQTTHESKARQIAEILKAKQDRRYHIQKHGWIKRRDADTRMVESMRMPPLRDSQLKVRAAQDWFKARGLTAKIIIEKSRKTGVSSYVQIDQVLDGIEYNYESVTISHRLEDADKLFDMGREAYEHYELEKPPLVGKGAKRRLEMANGASFEVLPGGSKFAGSGRTPQRLHWSEVPKTPHAADLFDSVINSVPEEPDCQIILESTAVGQDAVFYGLWKQTTDCCTVSWYRSEGRPAIDVDIPDMDKWNGWLPIFISPADNPDDRRPFTSDRHAREFEATLSNYERRYIESSGLEGRDALECVNWVRYMELSKCRGDSRRRKQEYPLFAEEAFGGTKLNRFNQEALLEVYQPRKGTRGYVAKRSRWDDSLSLHPDSQQDLIVFEPPRQGCIYAMGIDPIKGATAEEIREERKVFELAALVVVNATDHFREAAAFGGEQYEEESLFKYAKAIADWYGAYVQLERGGGYGTHLMKEFERSDFPKGMLYRDERDKRVGYCMTVATEPMLIKNAAKMLDSRDFILHHKATFAQYCEALKSRFGGAQHERLKTNDFLKAHAHALWCGNWALSLGRQAGGKPRRRRARRPRAKLGRYDYFH